MGKFAEIAKQSLETVEVHVEFEKTSRINPNKPHVVVCNDDGYEVHLIHVTNKRNGDEIEDCTLEAVKAISAAMKVSFPDHIFTKTPPEGVDAKEWKPVVKMRSFYNKLVFNAGTTRSYSVSEARPENTIFLHSFEGKIGDDINPSEADAEKYHEQWWNYLTDAAKASPKKSK